MTYKNLPIHISSTNSFGSGNHILADSISVSYSTQSQANRKLGQNIEQKNQFSFSGPQQVSLEVGFKIQSSSQEAYKFLSDADNGTGLNDLFIKIGNDVFSGCHINNYGFSVRPFEPVGGKASFTCYNPPTTGRLINGSDSFDNLNSNRIVYGHTCVVSGFGAVIDGGVISSMDYSKSYGVTPVYCLGQIEPSRYLLNSVEAEMKIESTGLNSLINFSGKLISSDVKVFLLDTSGNAVLPSASGIDPNMPSGSRVLDQNYSMQGGDSSVTSAALKHIIV